jgi:hypothetical protein
MFRKSIKVKVVGLGGQLNLFGDIHSTENSNVGLSLAHLPFIPFIIGLNRALHTVYTNSTQNPLVKPYQGVLVY